MSTAATDHSPCRIRCSPPRLTPSGIRYGPLVANTTSRKGSAVPEDTFGHPEAFLDLPQLVIGAASSISTANLQAAARARRALYARRLSIQCRPPHGLPHDC
jgi:hypothetical protein